MERNPLCNFGRGHHEEQLREIILNLDQWFRSRLKEFLSRALVALMFSGAEPFFAILVEGIKGNTCKIMILNLDQWFMRRCRLKKKFMHDGQTKNDHNSLP